ncbi:uncharacterized protein [Lolium perenne]|uniref:uncharacterized protein isoform X2 n=1 Tax=Lolium perenne TaxID=4522 RepID=UPI003A9A0A3E
MGLLTDKKSCKNLKTGHLGNATLCFTPGPNQSLDGNQIKATNMCTECCCRVWLLPFLPLPCAGGAAVHQLGLPIVNGLSTPSAPSTMSSTVKTRTTFRIS